MASLLKTLSYPARLMIFCTLVEGEYSDREREEKLDLHQLHLTQHLMMLRGSAIVSIRRDGKQIFCTYGREGRHPLWHFLREGRQIIEYFPSLAGGMLIGLSAVMLLLLNGRIAGISGIISRVAQGVSLATNLSHVLGLLLGPVVSQLVFDGRPAVEKTAGWPLIVVAGLLVGFGSRMGSCCTSGHGVLGRPPSRHARW